MLARHMCSQAITASQVALGSPLAGSTSGRIQSLTITDPVANPYLDMGKGKYVLHGSNPTLKRQACKPHSYCGASDGKCEK